MRGRRAVPLSAVPLSAGPLSAGPKPARGAAGPAPAARPRMRKAPRELSLKENGGGGGGGGGAEPARRCPRAAGGERRSSARAGRGLPCLATPGGSLQCHSWCGPVTARSLPPSLEERPGMRVGDAGQRTHLARNAPLTTTASPGDGVTNCRAPSARADAASAGRRRSLSLARSLSERTRSLYGEAPFFPLFSMVRVQAPPCGGGGHLGRVAAAAGARCVPARGTGDAVRRCGPAGERGRLALSPISR